MIHVRASLGIVVLAWLGLVSSVPVWAEQTTAEEERNSLRDIGPVVVHFLPLDEDASTIGLTEDGVRRTVELQLQANGVPVEGESNSLAPLLFVRLMVLGPAPWGVYLNVELLQVSSILANQEIRRRRTWDRGIQGRYPTAASARQAIRDALSNLVDIFSNDYRTVNPTPTVRTCSTDSTGLSSKGTPLILNDSFRGNTVHWQNTEGEHHE